MIDINKLKVLLLLSGMLLVTLITPVHAHYLINKNWHMVTQLDKVGSKWVLENVSGSLIYDLEVRQDGVFHKVNPNDKVIISVDGIYQYDD